MTEIATPTVTKNQGKYAIGVTFGIITGLVYIILLLVKYNFFAFSPVAYNTFALISYGIVLALFVFCGIRRKKQLGGFAEIREIFLSLFLALLITEIVYTFFNYLYLNFIDPDFLNRYLQTTYDYLVKKHINAEGVQMKMEQLKQQSHAINNITFSLMGLGLWIIIDSLLCLVISLAIRKPRPQY